MFECVAVASRFEYVTAKFEGKALRFEVFPARLEVLATKFECLAAKFECLDANFEHSFARLFRVSSLISPENHFVKSSRQLNVSSF